MSLLMEKYAKMVQFCKDNGQELSERQLEQFDQYYHTLVKENEVMNLTSITEFEDVLEKHFIDSICIFKYFDLTKIQSVIDIGTGAGFPGIPLKIMFPHLKVVLLDSLKKRVGFLNGVIEELGLENIKAIHGRAEDYGRDKEYREQFDLCVSRAVANLSSLSEYCIPFVKKDGHFIPYKSGAIGEELEAAKKAVHILGGTIDHTDVFCLPESDIERSFVFIEKKKNTSALYPRKAGTPAKKPLK